MFCSSVGGGGGRAGVKRNNLDVLLDIHENCRGIGHLFEKCNAIFLHFAGIDYGQPWRRTFGENIVYTDWKRDNYYHAVQQQVCMRITVIVKFVAGYFPFLAVTKTSIISTRLATRKQ